MRCSTTSSTKTATTMATKPHNNKKRTNSSSLKQRTRRQVRDSERLESRCLQARTAMTYMGIRMMMMRNNTLTMRRIKSNSKIKLQVIRRGRKKRARN